MTRQTGIIITVATAVVFGCCGIFSCLGGIVTLAGGGTYELGEFAGQTPPGYGITGICFGILFVLIPVAAWYFLVRGKEDVEGEVAPPPAA
jgi:hypothetical protein